MADFFLDDGGYLAARELRRQNHVEGRVEDHRLLFTGQREFQDFVDRTVVLGKLGVVLVDVEHVSVGNGLQIEFHFAIRIPAEILLAGGQQLGTQVAENLDVSLFPVGQLSQEFFGVLILGQFCRFPVELLAILFYVDGNGEDFVQVEFLRHLLCTFPK